MIRLDGFFTSVRLLIGTVVVLEFENDEAESLTLPLVLPLEALP